GYLVDVTARKRMNVVMEEMRAEAERARQQFVELSNTLPLAVFQYRPDEGGEGGSYLFVSEKVRDVLGVTAEEIYADSTARWRHVPAQERARYESLTQHMGTDRLDVEFEHTVDLFGALRWTHAFAVPSRLPSGDWVWNGFWMD